MVSVEESAARYLEKMEPAIQGQRGSDAAFKAALSLVQGFDLAEETALRLFLSVYNPRCIPQWSEREARHKIRSANRARSNRPRGYLLNASEQSERKAGVRQTLAPHLGKPTQHDCKSIATGRNLHGTGIGLAAELGVLWAGTWFGEEVWAIGDAQGYPAALRRIDGHPFPIYGSVAERKTHCLVRDKLYHRPHGNIPDLPDVESIALFEGLPDLLAGWEQVLWESSITAKRGNPYDLGDLQTLKQEICCLPLTMLSTSARIDGDSIEFFRDRKVRIFVHNEDAGKAAAQKWATTIHRVAKRIDFYDCGKLKDVPGADFNDCYHLTHERVLP